MNSNLQIFKNEQFGEVRTINKDGEPWFIGKDVAEKLGYARPTKAIQDKVDEDDKDVVPIQDSIGRNQNTPIINESGLYSLILSSKLPSAKKFKKWVTGEILPTIRKTGGYINNTERMVNTYFGALDDTRKTLVKGLFENIEQQQKQISELKPKAEGFTQFLDTKDTYSWDIVAKNLGIGRNTMLSILRENNILQESTYTDYKGRKCYGEKHNVPYQAYMKFFDVKFLVKGDKKFSKVTVNAEGQEYLRRKLIKLGYLKEAA
ncbi:TPA: hypothetical protein I9089_002443 [Clostridium perfringens]|nr:hypothetical protein [Clostridium perfringens]